MAVCPCGMRYMEYHIILQTDSPVGSDLSIQSHLDIEQILVFPEVVRHLPLHSLQLAVQLMDHLLGKKEEGRRGCIRREQDRVRVSSQTHVIG